MSEENKLKQIDICYIRFNEGCDLDCGKHCGYYNLYEKYIALELVLKNVKNNLSNIG